MNISRENEGPEVKNGNDSFVFKLYVTGASPNSTRAITNLKTFLDRYLLNRHDLEIIDVYQDPKITHRVDIIALPMLIKKSPLPERRFIGDMSDTKKILVNLGIEDRKT